MSIKLVAAIWERQLDHPEQAVLQAMADHADDDGRHVYPSILRIAWKTGYSARQVKRIGKALRELGALVFVAAATKNRPVEYRINLNALPKKETFEEYYAREKSGDNMAPQDHADDQVTNPVTDEGTSEQNGVTNQVKSGDIAAASKPSVETSSKTSKETSSKRKKPRLQKHPAIELFKKVRGRYPRGVLHPQVIEALSGNPDVEKLKLYYRTWVSRGYNEWGMDWLFEWYAKGEIPQRNGSRPPAPAPVDYTGVLGLREDDD